MKNSIVFIICVMLATALTVVSGCDKNNPDDNGQQPVLERLIMDTTDLVLEEGQTYALEVSTVPENAVDVELTWKSSDSLVATVSGTGLVTAVSEGEAVITAASSGIEAICNVTVVPAEEEKPEVETVTVTPSETVVMIGETVTLGVTVTPEDADYTLAWSSSDSDIASVDDNGTVTALAAGIISDLTAFREAHQAPAGSSGWYIPSASEWAVISAGDYDGDALTLASAVNLELINGMLEKIEGADKIEGFDMGIMVLPGTFWSSTEMNATQGAGFVTSGSMVPTGKAEVNKIRAILAF